MKKASKSKSAKPVVDPYLEGLMAKLLDRLVSLESKMDVVVAQTSSRPQVSGQAPKPASQHPPKEFPRRERVMYETVCADCKSLCEVPFKPSEGRAVYCKPCFALRKAGGPPSPAPAAKPPVPAPAADKKPSAPAKKKKKKK